MCVRTHVLFNSYLMYVTILTFSSYQKSVLCLIPYYIYREEDYAASWNRSSSWAVVQIRLFAHRYGDGLEAQIVFRQVDESLVAPVLTP